MHFYLCLYNICNIWLLNFNLGEGSTWRKTWHLLYFFFNFERFHTGGNFVDVGLIILPLKIVFLVLS